MKSLLAFSLALLSACAAPVQVSTFDSHGRPDLTPHYEYRPADLVDRLDPPELIETLREARRVEDVLPDLAAERYLAAAELAYGLIIDPATSDYDRALIVAEVYNRAVAGYIRTSPPSRFDTRVAIDVAADGVWPDPEYFNTYTPAADVRIEGLREHHVQRGIGAPLIASRDAAQRDEIEALYPPEGIVWPATALLLFDRPDKPRLLLLDPRKTATIKLSDSSYAGNEITAEPFTRREIEVPLAADFSAPYAQLLSRTQELASLGFAGMLDPSASEDRLGVYLLEPYDPDKTPLLMVHGLMSTPLTWIELTNEIQADPELREKYQVWHFLYPTATCPYYSAFYLRTKLDETRRLLDPELDDFATNDIVVVGHSMGGILTRTLVSDTGRDAWNVAFTVGPDELEGAPNAIDFLKSVYIYERRPYVRRVVFVATPHRGSDFANNLVGAFGRSLVRLPRQCIDLTVAIAQANRDRLQPGYGPWLLNGPPSSIDILRPESPASAAADLIPIADEVTYHSIIGTRELINDPDDAPETSDGIVAYWSSHLDGAASEKLVPAPHNAHDHPDAIAEIKRILHEHAFEVPAAAVSVAIRK
ncbi:MAG: alpha/beta fold hydrolase [Planctomycetota bacterium]